MQSASMEIAFSADDVSTRAGLERWRETMGRAVLKLDLELAPDRPFASHVRALVLPDVGIARARKSGLRMVRPHGNPDRNDNLSLHVATSGSWRLEQRGARAELAPRFAALVLNDEAAIVDCPTPTTALCIQFPRRALEGRVCDALGRVMQPVAGEALDLLVDYVELLERRPLPAAAVADAVSAHILDLIALVVGPTREGRALSEEGGVRTAWLRRIESHVRENAARHDLSVSTVAAHHRITPRYLQRLFHATGTTFSRYLLEVRLTEAHRQLVARGAVHRSIGAIAYDVGFADVSYFNRVFKRRFGARPSEVRGEAGFATQTKS